MTCLFTAMASWAASITAATAGVTPLRKTFPDGETYFLPFITPMVEGTLSALEAVTPVRWPSIGSDFQSNTKFCEYAGTAASSITSREKEWRKRFILRGCYFILSHFHRSLKVVFFPNRRIPAL